MKSLAKMFSGLVGGALEPVLKLIADAPQLNHLDGLVSLWHPQGQ
jgi:hypothetical protein